MAGAKIVKQLCIERGIMLKELAVKLGINPQSLGNKMYRDTFTYADMVEIADLLDADVVVVTRDSKKQFR